MSERLIVDCLLFVKCVIPHTVPSTRDLHSV